MASIAAELLKDALPELFVEKGVLHAEQAFERRLAEYEMNLEQQKLVREDVRDLVELTVGRMDVYHLVGAMLLEFCISFYCKNRMVEEQSSSTPPWLLSFFLVSNLSALGYLIFAVWLAMHAAVASHSIGVRLLTRFARLSIPSREELNCVASAPLVPLLDRLASLGKRFGFTGPTMYSAAEPAQRGEPGDDWCRGESGGSALDEGARVAGDRSLHFRRFLKEQRRWLNYDAYARVCMSLGINQMISALSYFTTGVYVERNPRACFITLAGLQMLSLLLLRLDVVPGRRPGRDFLVVLLLVPLPTIYIGSLLAVVRYLHVLHIPSGALAVLAAPAFLLHAGWLLIVATVVTPYGPSGVKSLPRQLRTVLYLDVLSTEQDATAYAVHAEEIRDACEPLRKARLALEAALRAVTAREQRDGQISTAARESTEIDHLQDELEACLETACESETGEGREKLREEIRHVRNALEYAEVWRKTPEMHHSLQALRSQEVQGWLTEEQRCKVEQAYQAFLHRCRDLDLGVLALPRAAPDARDTLTKATSSSSSLSALGVPLAEAPAVKVHMPPEYGDGWTPADVWVDPSLHTLQNEQPRLERTSYSQVFGDELPQWTQNALRLRTQNSMPSSPGEQPRISRSTSVSVEVAGSQRPPSATPLRLVRQLSRQYSSATICGPYEVRRIETSNLPLLPAWATPPERLPGHTVRRFTQGLALLWVVAGGVHAAEVAYGQSFSTTALAVAPVVVAWPEPAALFEADALHCNASLLAVRGRFTLLAARRAGDGKEIGHFVEVPAPAGADAATVAALSCEPTGCVALTVPSRKAGSDWTFAALPPPWGSGREASRFALPRSWRVVAVARAPCDHAGACDALTIAGWDGHEVTVAGAARRDGAWRLRSRFALRPGRGDCTSVGYSVGGPARVSAAVPAYDDVVALAFGPGASSLVVLVRGGRLDAWDLRAGAALGAWRLPTVRAPRAVCFDGQALIFARPGPAGAGPELLRAAAPPALRRAAACSGDDVAEDFAASLREAVEDELPLVAATAGRWAAPGWAAPPLLLGLAVAATLADTRFSAWPGQHRRGIQDVAAARGGASAREFELAAAP